MATLFTRIFNGEIPATIVYKDEQSLAILDIHPLTAGHTLVIPRQEAKTILELNDDAVQALFLTLKRVTGILDKALKPHGFTIGINHGEAAGQAVPHLHIHVIPRYASDGGKQIHSLISAPPHLSLEEVREKIQAVIH